LGSSGFWEKNERVTEVMPELGKSEEIDRQKLEELLSRMIAGDPTEDKLGLQNMTSIFINFN